MKHRRTPPPLDSLKRRRRVGAAGTGSDPTPGWKARTLPFAFANARLPSVPATLDLTLEEYFSAGALMGLIASQADEPNQQWAAQWSFKMGRKMAEFALRERRRRQSPKPRSR